MLAVGLFAFRILIARPLLRAVPGSSLRPVTIAYIAALGVSLVAVPVYLRRLDGEVRAALDARPRDADPARPRLGVRAELRRPLDRARAVRGRCARGDRDRPPVAHDPLGRRAARDRLGPRHGGRAARDPGHRRPRLADLAGGPRARPRLGASRLRLGLDRRAAGPAGAVVRDARRAPQGDADARRPALLGGRVRVGPAAARLGRRGLVPAPADAREPLGDELRQGHPDQVGAARS